MAIQYSTAVRNGMVDAIETVIGTSPILRVRTGAPPANPAAARTGTVLATLNLPSDWLTNASGGVKSLQGVWADSSADAAGNAGHYEIMDSSATTCHEQGTVTATGGGGDMTLDNVNLATGQNFTVTSYSRTAPNA
jgi:hypothetical protein